MARKKVMNRLGDYVEAEAQGESNPPRPPFEKMPAVFYAQGEDTPAFFERNSRVRKTDIWPRFLEAVDRDPRVIPLLHAVYERVYRGAG